MATTQLQPTALPGRPYGSFALKAGAVVVTGLTFGAVTLVPTWGAASLIPTWGAVTVEDP